MSPPANNQIMSSQYIACSKDSSKDLILKKFNKSVGGVRNIDQIELGAKLLRNPHNFDLARVSKLYLYAIDSETIELISHHMPCLSSLSVYHSTEVRDRECLDISKYLLSLKRLYLNCEGASENTVSKVVRNLPKLEYLKMIGTGISAKREQELKKKYKFKLGMFL